MEKGILFNGDMVRAILDGRKTETRRPLVPQPMVFPVPPCNPLYSVEWKNILWSKDGTAPIKSMQRYLPHLTGDLLYVRENFYVQPELWERSHDEQPIHYAADNGIASLEDYIQKPSIHMPKWAARIWLEVTGVKVQRLQEITEEELFNEGGFGTSTELNYLGFIDVWDSIYAKQGLGWKANPWVTVTQFKRIK